MLRAGQQIGSFRIISPLGAGGMGEVWRATDTKLGRQVALKVLPEAFAEDAERMARFEREARVLASLNHPNIATLYGLETVDSGTGTGPGTRAGRDENPASSFQHPTSREAAVTVLVMELVEGEDLSELIERGPIPIDEAVPIALQIAEALEAAHEAGIVHRDLKPANIKLRADGAVKVLDFGLAKTWDPDPSGVDVAQSPTLTRYATAAGVLLGTAAYMSPEQVRGRRADRRADIWAFGVVLWEMLAGRRMFDGETVSDVLASVLKESPPIDDLPSGVPPRIRRLIRRCLERDPRQRLQWIGDARLELEGGGDEPSATAAATPAGSTRWRLLPWLVAAGAAAATATLAVLLHMDREPEPPIIRFELPPPRGGFFHLAPDHPGPAAVSPDGTMITFAARCEDGRVRLWVRDLDSTELRMLPGTEDARYPFWSPDSRRIGFADAAKLRVIDATGGSPLTLCDAPDGKGGTWSRDGVIVFSPSYNSPLHRVSEAGGVSAPVTELDAERGDTSHRHPRFLPDGHHFLYAARASSSTDEGHPVVVGSLDGSSTVLPLRSPAAVEYASGHLIFPRERTLMARPFDAAKLRFTGEPFPIADDVTLLAPGTVAGVYSASQSGVLAFQQGRGGGGTLRLVWKDRAGRELGTVGRSAGYDDIQLLPDGRQLAAGLTDSAGSARDLWVFDLERDVASRFTFSPGFETGMTPSADGTTLYFSTETSGVFALHRKTIGGSHDAELLLESPGDLFPTSASPDGTLLALTTTRGNNGYDVFILPLVNPGEPYPLLQTPFDEEAATFSPDGRWLAYQSNESGREEVYVTPFAGLGRKWQISTAGGMLPRWRSDGSELLYQAPDGTLMAVSISVTGDDLAAAAPVALFNTGVQPSDFPTWALSPDGQRVLIVEPVVGSDTTRITVVVNWLAGQGAR
jgi:Tol biopolymer transport system component